MAVDLIARALALKAAGGGSGGSGFAEEADLNSPEFAPEENKYYLQKTSGEPAPIDWQVFVVSKTLPTTYALHFDTSREQDLLAFFTLVAGQERSKVASFYYQMNDGGRYGVVLSATHLSAEDTGTVDADVLMLTLALAEDSHDYIPIYSTEEFDLSKDGFSRHFIKGFQNLDPDGNLFVTTPDEWPIQFVGMSPDPTIWENFDWNGSFVSWAEMEEPAYKDGILYFYDNGKMYAVNGELSHEAVVSLLPTDTTDGDLLSVKTVGRKTQCSELITAGDIIDDIYVDTNLFGGANDITAAGAVGHSEQITSYTTLKTLIDLTVSEYDESSDTTTITDVKIGVSYSYLYLYRKERSASSWSGDVLYKDYETNSWKKSCDYGKYIYILNRFTANNRTHNEPKVATITVNNVYGQEVWSQWMGKKQQFDVIDEGQKQIHTTGPSNGMQVLKSSGDKYRLIFHSVDGERYNNNSVYTQYTNSDIGDSLYFNTSLSKDALVGILNTLYSFNYFYMQIDQRGYGTEYLIVGQSQSSSNDYAIAVCDKNKTNITRKIYASAALDDYNFIYFGDASGTAFEAKWYTEEIRFSAPARLTDHSSSYSYTTPEYGQLLTIDGGIWFNSAKETNTIWDELKLSDIKFDDEGIGMAQVAFGLQSESGQLKKYSFTLSFPGQTGRRDNTELLLYRVRDICYDSDDGSRIYSIDLSGSSTLGDIHYIRIVNPQIIFNDYNSMSSMFVIKSAAFSYSSGRDQYNIADATFYVRSRTGGQYEIRCMLSMDGSEADFNITTVSVGYFAKRESYPDN